MRVFDVQKTIDVASERVWTILNDAGELTSATLGIIGLEGRIAERQKQKLWSALSPQRNIAIGQMADAPSTAAKAR